jgi:signal recognition particle GTPase
MTIKTPEECQDKKHINVWMMIGIQGSGLKEF